MERHILAYVDPGTGALLFQILIAGLLSVLVFFRNAARRVLGLFARPFLRIARRPCGETNPLRVAARQGSESPTNAP